MALVDTLDWIPISHEAREPIIEMLTEFLDAIVGAQQPSGLWLQVMDKPKTPGNYEETSVSAMFAYVLYKSLRKGFARNVDHAQVWKRSANAALKGLISKRVRWECSQASMAPRLHLDGICRVAGLGGEPYRDGSFAYYISEPIVSDDFKGSGPFILAITEALYV